MTSTESITSTNLSIPGYDAASVKRVAERHLPIFQCWRSIRVTRWKTGERQAGFQSEPRCGFKTPENSFRLCGEREGAENPQTKECRATLWPSNTHGALQWSHMQHMLVCVCVCGIFWSILLFCHQLWTIISCLATIIFYLNCWI